MIWDMGKVCAKGARSAPSICKVTFQNISLVTYKYLITMVTMERLKSIDVGEYLLFY